MSLENSVSIVIRMTNQKLQYVPQFKMGDFRYYRIKWLSFQNNLSANLRVLFLSVNDFGHGFQTSNWLDTAPSAAPVVPTAVTPQTYSFSMPLEFNARINYDSGSDVYRWVELPINPNLRNFTFYAWVDQFPKGAAPPTLISPTEVLTFEIEFRKELYETHI